MRLSQASKLTGKQKIQGEYDYWKNVYMVASEKGDTALMDRASTMMDNVAQKSTSIKKKQMRPTSFRYGKMFVY